MSFESKPKVWICYFLLASAVGALVETTAYFLEWWVFNPTWFFIIWIFLWEGLCFGTLAYFTRNLHILIQYGASAALGCFGEVFAACIYPIWVFPGDSFLFLHGILAIIIVFTIIWGLVCPGLTLLVNRITQKGNKSP